MYSCGTCWESLGNCRCTEKEKEAFYKRIARPVTKYEIEESRKRTKAFVAFFAEKVDNMILDVLKEGRIENGQR